MQQYIVVIESSFMDNRPKSNQIQWNMKNQYDMLS